MHNFQPGDVVKVINSVELHEQWKGRIGTVLGLATAYSDVWIVKMDDTDEESWWLSESLEFLGTEASLVEQVLGDYFA